ncbi:MAG TPA: carbon storage regulator CsrA [Candidatus Methylomirabilis sp.]|nr:carbon storage regulator CsrA [Candidatus Methylomirabilis sp.]
MLVVSRKPGERLLIGESVEVTVLGIRGDQVRLGVSAPREVTIHREELLERIRRENRRAAVLGSEELHAMGARLRAGLSPPTPSTGSPDDLPPGSAPPKDAAEAARAS